MSPFLVLLLKVHPATHILSASKRPGAAPAGLQLHGASLVQPLLPPAASSIPAPGGSSESSACNAAATASTRSGSLRRGAHTHAPATCLQAGQPKLASAAPLRSSKSLSTCRRLRGASAEWACLRLSARKLSRHGRAA